MTAFSRAQIQNDSVTLCWEIKSVNHRYLEASFKIPDGFRHLEHACRSHFKNIVSRGKLDCQLKINWTCQKPQTILLNEPLVEGLIKAGKQLSSDYLIPDDLTVSQILAWPDVVKTTEPDEGMIAQSVLTLFQEAMTELYKVREQEGQKLEQFIETRLEKLLKEVDLAQESVSHLSKNNKVKLQKRLDELELTTVIESKIEQEIALMLARLDVSEELDRLRAHIDEVSKVIKRQGAVGRRLDFLMQELNREANTLSSKSDSPELTRQAVEMKVLIEQMREQIQNIE
tara:strand:- start:17 stop:874 length:858 start_codon:yes stop_codon:yes gene_type:complete